MSCSNNEQLSFAGKKNFDIKQALADSNKPLLIYFNSIACGNCERMENGILTDQNVINYIQKEYNLITLFVSDLEFLPKDKWRKNWKGKLIKTNGSSNVDYQTKLTRSGTQPIFAIVRNEESADSIIGYTKNTEEFIEFLDKGLKK